MKTKLLLITGLFLVLMIYETKAQIFEKVVNDAFKQIKEPTDGVAWIDYNDDGKIDIYRANFSNTGCTLFENKGDGTFAFIRNNVITPTTSSGAFSGITWGDYDNDGKADIFLANLTGSFALYKNSGNGKFMQITDSRVTQDQIISLQAMWIDYDNDGWLDLFVPTAPNIGFYAQTGDKNLLYHNNGDGSFTKITQGPVVNDLGSHSCAAFADMDNDGDQDLFVPEWGKNSFLYENNGDGTFKNITGSPVNTNSSMSISCSWGDYDNDGFMDLFVGNGSTSSTEKQYNFLFHNNGNKTFTKVNAGELTQYKGCTWSETWGDVDNDGDLDMLLGNIYDPSQLFLNNGDGTFKNANEFSSDIISAAGVCFGDYDEDGFIDLAMGNAGSDELSEILFHNKGNNNHWIQIKCKGVLSNRSAIGARVKVKATIGGKSYWQIREINGNQGHRNYNDLTAHFGLGNATTIDSLVILWPSGQKTTMKDISIDQILNVTEGVPDNYLGPNFTADTLKGKDSLKVTFSDISIFDPNKPVIKWKWDFNGDGVTDSEEKNPVRTFLATDYEVSYSIGLTIISVNDTASLLKKDFINLRKSRCKDCVNLSKFKKAYASSIEAGGLAAAKAIDASTESRWSSSFNDNQWFMVNLVNSDTISAIVLKWENAAAQEYRIKVSEDSITWKEIYYTKKCPGGVDEIVFAPVKAKFVKMEGITRKSPYGYSLYEFEVYGYGEEWTEIKSKTTTTSNLKAIPNPFNYQTDIKYTINDESDVELSIFNMNGQKINSINYRNLNAGEYSFTLKADNMPEGLYICRIDVKNNKNSFFEVSKLLKTK